MVKNLGCFGERELFGYYNFKTDSFFFDTVDLSDVFKDIDLLPNSVYKKMGNLNYKIRMCGVPRVLIHRRLGYLTYRLSNIGNFLDNKVRIYVGASESDDNGSDYVFAVDLFDKNLRIGTGLNTTHLSFRALTSNEVSLEASADSAEFRYIVSISAEIAYMLLSNEKFRKAVFSLIFIDSLEGATPLV